jgi:hypothetical protein
LLDPPQSLIDLDVSPIAPVMPPIAPIISNQQHRASVEIDAFTPPAPYPTEFSQADMPDSTEFNFSPSAFPAIKQELIKRQGLLCLKRKDGWRSRWCILTTGFLFLYKDEKSEVKGMSKEKSGVKGMMKVGRVESAGKNESRKKNVFSISSGEGGEVNLFQAGSADEMSEWMADIAESSWERCTKTEIDDAIASLFPQKGEESSTGAKEIKRDGSKKKRRMFLIN